MSAVLPIGRFAPSPTGHLHLGSLTTAVASYCHIKSLGGKWLLRIEDVDFERCKPSYTQSILQDLKNLGLHHDDDVVFQSDRQDIYEDFLTHELAKYCYLCTCSRKDLASRPSLQNTPNPTDVFLSTTQSLNNPLVYPRLCLHKGLSPSPESKTRLILPNTLTAYHDGICGVLWDNPAISLGDVVVKRQNGMFNYILAAVIDDGLQGVTHVMRGMDIMPMTVAQIAIAKLCNLTPPQYFFHLPLLHNKDGQKLSKQNLATPIDTSTPQKCQNLLVQALTLLRQDTLPDMADHSTADILQFAIKNWNHKALCNLANLGIAH